MSSSFGESLPSRPKPLIEIGLLVYPDFQIQDLSGLLAPFEVAATVTPDTAYRTHVVSLAGGLVRSSSGVEILTEKIASSSYDSLLLVGGKLHMSSSQRLGLVQQLKNAFSQKTRRIAAVSTGSFLLAEAGLLDNRIATTHWKYIAQFQRQYPRTKVAGDRIYTRDENIWTSAGVTAGFDLALALIEEDLGVKVAQLIAQFLVTYYNRPGSQLQFCAMDDLEPDSHRISAVLTYIKSNLSMPLSTDELAKVAHLGPRQFCRAFVGCTGETPAKTVERLRVEEARKQLEQGQDSIEAIATSSGFGDQARMRKAFIRITGHPPQSIRRLANLNSDSGIPPQRK